MNCLPNIGVRCFNRVNSNIFNGLKMNILYLEDLAYMLHKIYCVGYIFRALHWRLTGRTQWSDDLCGATCRHAVTCRLLRLVFLYNAMQRPRFQTIPVLAHCVVCPSVTFCIAAKRHVLAKNCLKEWIGNQGQNFDFLGRCHISTSGFTAMETETAVFVLFLPVQPSNRYKMVQMDFLAANHVRIVGLCGQNWNRK